MGGSDQLIIEKEIDFVDSENSDQLDGTDEDLFKSISK
jgi:hypothetical protein